MIEQDQLSLRIARLQEAIELTDTALQRNPTRLVQPFALPCCGDARLSTGTRAIDLGLPDRDARRDFFARQRPTPARPQKKADSGEPGATHHASNRDVTVMPQRPPVMSPKTTFASRSFSPMYAEMSGVNRVSKRITYNISPTMPVSSTIANSVFPFSRPYVSAVSPPSKTVSPIVTPYPAPNQPPAIAFS